MNFRSKTNITTIYPNFVMHKLWETPAGFNDRLYELAKDDANRNRVVTDSDPENIGGRANHISHLRHNFLIDCRESEVKQLTLMAEAAAREYLLAVYNYDHQGEIRMMSDTFWQTRENGANAGIHCHTHPKSDLVVTYYPRLRINQSEQNDFRRGVLRFYDPANVGKRYWPCNNPSFHIGGWFQFEPQEGSMAVFEGYLPHDSSYFEGEERMCIPIQVGIETPKSHRRVPVEQILAAHDGVEG